MMIPLAPIAMARIGLGSGTPQPGVQPPAPKPLAKPPQVFPGYPQQGAPQGNTPQPPDPQAPPKQPGVQVPQGKPGVQAASGYEPRPLAYQAPDAIQPPPGWSPTESHKLTQTNQESHYESMAEPQVVYGYHDELDHFGDPHSLWGPVSTWNPWKNSINSNTSSSLTEGHGDPYLARMQIQSGNLANQESATRMAAMSDPQMRGLEFAKQQEELENTRDPFRAMKQNPELYGAMQAFQHDPVMGRKMLEEWMDKNPQQTAPGVGVQKAPGQVGVQSLTSPQAEGSPPPQASLPPNRNIGKMPAEIRENVAWHQQNLKSAPLQAWAGEYAARPEAKAAMDFFGALNRSGDQDFLNGNPASPTWKYAQAVVADMLTRAPYQTLEELLPDLKSDDSYKADAAAYALYQFQKLMGINAPTPRPYRNPKAGPSILPAESATPGEQSGFFSTPVIPYF